MMPCGNIMKRMFHRTSYYLKIIPSGLKDKSSHAWMTRHLNDPYVKRAKMENYRARSAFKLIEIDDRFKIFKPGQMVIDCGCAPGAWSQVATKRINARKVDPCSPVGKVIAIDLNYTSPIEGAFIISHADFTLPNIQQIIVQHLNGQKPDVILSDMAPNASGVRELDNENIVILGSAALAFAIQTLEVGGVFVCKVWDGACTPRLEKNVEKFFSYFKRVKPAASRTESAEVFLLGKGFKGATTM